MDKLPWNSEGKTSNQFTTQFTSFNGKKVQILTLRCAEGTGAGSEPRGLDGRRNFWVLSPQTNSCLL